MREMKTVYAIEIWIWDPEKKEYYSINTTYTSEYNGSDQKAYDAALRYFRSLELSADRPRKVLYRYFEYEDGGFTEDEIIEEEDA